MEWRGSPLGWKKNHEQSSAPEQDWHHGAGGLLLVAAAHETGLLAQLATAITPCLTQTSLCWLHESSAENREGLISSVTSYFDAFQASKARVMKKLSLRSVKRSYKERQILLQGFSQMPRRVHEE